MSDEPRSFFDHFDRARRHVEAMWSRRYDTDTDLIPDVKRGESFGSSVAVDLGGLCVAETELMLAARKLERQDGFVLTRWVAGPPKEAGDYHLIMDSKGGEPFCVVGHVMTRWKEGGDPTVPTDELPYQMELCFLIPELNESLPAWSKLTSLWTCNAHRLIPEPSEP